jgi:hypothetical protein
LEGSGRDRCEERPHGVGGTGEGRSVLRPDMPRSLAACMNEVVANLQLVANQQSAETLLRAGRLKSTCNTAASTRSWPPACTPT